MENPAKDRKCLRRLESIAVDHNIILWKINTKIVVKRYRAATR